MKNLKKASLSVFGLSAVFLSLCMSNCNDETPKANAPQDTSKVINDCKSCVVIVPKDKINKDKLEIIGESEYFIKSKFNVIELSKGSNEWVLKSESGNLYDIKCRFPENLKVEGKEIIIDATSYKLSIPSNIDFFIVEPICISKIY